MPPITSTTISTSEDRTSSIFSVHCTEDGSQSTFFRATLRLRTCVRRKWVFDRSQRILAAELPTVPKPTRATLQFCAARFLEPTFLASTFFAPTTARLPVESSLEVPVIRSPVLQLAFGLRFGLMVWWAAAPFQPRGRQTCFPALFHYRRSGMADASQLRRYARYACDEKD